jgi:hypothetical protein
MNPEDLRLRMIAWDMYYSGIMSMSLHPGTTRDKAIVRTPEEAALIADAMLKERDNRFFWENIND